MAAFAAPDPETTVAQLIDQYLASADFAALAANTRRAHGGAMKRLAAVFGAVRVRDWRPAWGQHFIDQRTPAAANRDRAVLSTLLARAVRAGVLDENPARELQGQPAPPRSRFVADSELAAFLRHCDARLRAYAALKLATGARAGQLIALPWTAWDGHRLAVPAAKGGRDTHYHGAAIAEALRLCRAAFAPGGTIVTTRAGRPYAAARHWNKHWQRAMRQFVAAGGERFREHDLRAVVASRRRRRWKSPRRCSATRRRESRPPSIAAARAAWKPRRFNPTFSRPPRRDPTNRCLCARRGGLTSPRPRRRLSLRDDVPRLRGDGPEEASASPVAPARSPSEPSPAGQGASARIARRGAVVLPAWWTPGTVVPAVDGDDRRQDPGRGAAGRAPACFRRQLFHGKHEGRSAARPGDAAEGPQRGLEAGALAAAWPASAVRLGTGTKGRPGAHPAAVGGFGALGSPRPIARNCRDGRRGRQAGLAGEGWTREKRR